MLCEINPDRRNLQGEWLLSMAAQKTTTLWRIRAGERGPSTTSGQTLRRQVTIEALPDAVPIPCASFDCDFPMHHLAAILATKRSWNGVFCSNKAFAAS